MIVHGRSSRRWFRYFIGVALSIIGMGLIALLVVNIIDFRRWWWASHFDQSEGLGKVRELAQMCFDLGKRGHIKLTKYPAKIDELNPTWVSIGENYAQIGLYERDGAAIFLVFQKDDEDEWAIICDYVHEPNDERVIWTRNQQAYDFLHPKNRIITLGEGTMGGYVEWIVLMDEVRVVMQPNSGGARLLGRRMISAEDKLAVESAVKALPETVRGKHFEAGVMDGIHLSVCFRADGKHGPEDIELDNTWREEAGPLVDLIERLSPEGHQLKFHSIIESELKARPRRQSAVTWSDEEQFERPRMPWWCIWPRLKM